MKKMILLLFLVSCTSYKNIKGLENSIDYPINQEKSIIEQN